MGRMRILPDAASGCSIRPFRLRLLTATLQSFAALIANGG
jgi:hypothetical protein